LLPKKQTAPPVPPTFISPNQLARRWCVSRSTVDRIARDNGFSRFAPGNGRNATVRFEFEEVLAYEQSRLTASAA
jgi:hypothetical protein